MPRQAVAWTRWQRLRASAWTLPRLISTVACKISYGPDTWSRTPTPLHRPHGGCIGSRLPGWMPRTAISIGRRHPDTCISIQPQIIPTASSADRADPGHRDGVLRGLIQDPASELRRILIPRTPVNKGRKKRERVEAARASTLSAVAATL